MNILRHFEDVPAAQRGGVYALGNFDGVHLGHQQVIKSAQAMAADMHAPMGLMVFEPHPLQFFFPERDFFRLTSFRSKAMVLQGLGVDILAALPFALARAGQEIRRSCNIWARWKVLE
ncbi:MAG: riboflavin kinase/FMN adenylyltransferase [Parvibaculaceae bacterium]|jgi:riboflavin kinase/FMN adenylyltransferase